MFVLFRFVMVKNYSVVNIRNEEENRSCVISGVGAFLHVQRTVVSSIS